MSRARAAPTLARMKRLTLLLALAATSCATRLAVIPTHPTGPHEQVVTVRAEDEIGFKTDVDLSYEDATPPSALYAVELLQDGVVVDRTICDAVHLGAVRACSVRVNVPGRYVARCSMSCTARVPKSGPTLVRATFSADNDVTIAHASLVVTQ